jgi:alpha-tubulin suppressor-like RCC1 family protein
MARHQPIEVYPMSSPVRYVPVLAAVLLVLVAGCSQEAESPTGPALGPALDATNTSSLSFSGMTSGDLHTCGVTTDHRALCWGFNFNGQLGAGISAPNRVLPTAVVGGLQFQQLSAGYSSTCGVTTDHRAYCWGRNDRGELGDGTTTQRLAPVAVTGGHKFTQVEVQFEHTCGVSYPDNKAYCWGWNADGQLGNGTRDSASHKTPIAVSGGLTFSLITTGYYHTCGLTTGNKLYCWGLNNEGQLGDNTSTFRRLRPTAVATTRQFRWVDAGAQYACAVATDSHAFCWGYGKLGQRGDGGIAERARTPRAVFGNHLFVRVTAAVEHTCGVTTSNQAWCWGLNLSGQIGDGSMTQRLTPHLVVGGLDLNQVSAGHLHTCGRTTAGIGYCWGGGFGGQLGNGGTSDSAAPGAVRPEAETSS